MKAHLHYAPSIYKVRARVKFVRVPILSNQKLDFSISLYDYYYSL